MTFDRAEFSVAFGRRLRAYRQLRRMSQMALAARTGFTQPTISNLERGEYFPAITTAFIVAEALEVHPKLLLFGEDE